jgi:hypothetical protein
MTETERLVSETMRSRREDRLAAHRQGVDADRPDVTGLRPDAEKIKRSHPRATRARLTESIEDRYYRPNRPGFIRGIPI